MDVTVLLDEDIVEDIIGHAVFVRLYDGRVGQGLVVGHVQALVVKVVAVAHPAAVKSLVGKALFEIGKDAVALFLIEILGRGLSVVVAELHGNVVLAPAIGVFLQLVGGIVHVEHAVHALFRGDARHDLVGRFLDIFRQVAGDIDAGDLVAVALGEGDHLLGAAARLHGEGRVDIHLMRCRHRVEHPLQVVQLRKRFAAGEDKVAVRGDLVHHGNTLEDRFHAEALGIGIFLLVYAEGAVIVAVIRHKDRDRGASFARFIGMSH